MAMNASAAALDGVFAGLEGLDQEGEARLERLGRLDVPDEPVAPESSWPLLAELSMGLASPRLA